MLHNLLCSTVSYFLAPFGFLMTQQVLNNCTAGYFKREIASDMTNQNEWLNFFQIFPIRYLFDEFYFLCSVPKTWQLF
jgi:hypothetical protein